MATDERIIEGLATVKAQQGEVNRRLGHIEKDLGSKYVSYSELKAIAKDVKDLEDVKTWVIRVVIGAVIVQVLAITFSSEIQKLIGG